jgi:glyoxylate carboligase
LNVVANKAPHPEEQQLPRVADVVVSTLLELGVDTFYGIPGGAICSVYDALLDTPAAKVINTRHETGAAFQATDSRAFSPPPDPESPIP